MPIGRPPLPRLAPMFFQTFVAVPLPHEKFFLVDLADAHEVLEHNWHLTGYRVQYPARSRKAGPGYPTVLSLHRYLLKPPPDMEVDHKNGDSLDNRRQNLRICTPAQNQHNTGLSRVNTSGFKGVSKRGKRWRAQIRISGKPTCLGTYDTPEEAGAVYNTTALKVQGKFAKND